MPVGDFLCDARFEVSLRWTILITIAYALFFYGPQGLFIWSLPVCLLAGAPSMIYNLGFQIYLGMGVCVCMCVVGLLLSAILPLIKNDDMVAAYFALMGIMTFFIVPFVSYAGYMDNFNAITVLMIIVMTESFYGPVRNVSAMLDGTADLFHFIVKGGFVTMILYTAIVVVAFLVPPLHLGKQQTHGIMALVISGYAKTLTAASNAVKTHDTKTLLLLSKTLFKSTNYAGLSTAISIFGGTSLNEVNPINNMCHSMPLDSYDVMGKIIDNCSMYITAFLYILGVYSEKGEETPAGTKALNESEDYRDVVGAYFESCANLCLAIADYLQEAARLKMGSKYLLEKEEAIAQAHRECQLSEEKLAQMSHNVNNINRLLMWRSTRELISGHEFISLIPKDGSSGPMERVLVRCNAMNRGVLGRLAFAVQKNEQGKIHYTSIKGLFNNILRISFMERALLILAQWCRSVLSLFDDDKLYSNPRVTATTKQPWYRERKTRRGMQLIIGTYALYAMSTFWDAYSSLLGTSKSGQWTLLAFYLCFRATTEETLYAALNRIIGQVIGCMSSWGINTAITSTGGRLAFHVCITAVLVWFIPPPPVYPSKIKFSFDKWLGQHIICGFLSSYHLTNTLVGSTTVFDAVKARMASQCLGSATAAFMSVVFLPWFTSKETPRTLRAFRQDLTMLLSSTDIEPYRIESRVNGLLDARRDWNAANSQKEWVDDMLGTLNIFGKKNDDDSDETAAPATEEPLLSQSEENMESLLIRACVAGFALEGYSRRIRALKDAELVFAIREAAAGGDLVKVQRILTKAITESDGVESDEGDLADLLLLVTMIADCDII